MSDALRPVTSQWIAKLRLAREHKRREFQDDADEAMKFFDGPYNWLYAGWKGQNAGRRAFAYSLGEEDMPGPSCEMTVNKVAELVQLFGPALYHRNPQRKVNPRKAPALPPELYGDPNDPNVQMYAQQMQMQSMQQRVTDKARGVLLEHYLNYTPEALDLKTQSRWAIDEALIKGMGVLWTELTHPGIGGKLTGSFFDSVDNLFGDPDAETWDECKWVARKCTHPVWQVEDDYKLPRGTLRTQGSLESYTAQATLGTDADGDWQRKKGESNDLVTYYKVYSKMGLGGRLSGMPKDDSGRYDSLPDQVYLVLVDGFHYPLNIPQPLCEYLASEDPNVRAQAAQAVAPMVQWETPFWADDAWPFTPIVFHQRPRKLWPMSHIKPAMGELYFLNWAWSFLAGKVRISSRDFIAVAKSAAEEVKSRIKHGPDYTVIEVEEIHGSIDNVVKFLQHPGFNPEIYKIIEGVTTNFERRTGLSELMYGMTNTQMRSAQEANVKADAISVRPDDMAAKVEEAMTNLARKEAFAARWHLRGADVVPIFGAEGAQWWEGLLVMSDPAELLRQLEYRVEANSTRKPNKALESANMKDALQNLLQPLFAYAQSTGDVNPMNALLTDWAKSIDLDATKYQLQPPPPPPPAGPPPVRVQGPPPK